MKELCRLICWINCKVYQWIKISFSKKIPSVFHLFHQKKSKWRTFKVILSIHFYALIIFHRLLLKIGLISDGSRSKIFDPGQVGSIFCGSGWVRSGQPFMVWVWIWKISPKKVKFFNFSLRVKKNLFGSGQKVPGSKVGLIYCRIKVSSGRVRAHL